MSDFSKDEIITMILSCVEVDKITTVRKLLGMLEGGDKEIHWEVEATGIVDSYPYENFPNIRLIKYISLAHKKDRSYNINLKKAKDICDKFKYGNCPVKLYFTDNEYKEFVFQMEGHLIYSASRFSIEDSELEQLFEF